jgi:D-sedoheptulose 7-phosphate isomerase
MPNSARNFEKISLNNPDADPRIQLFQDQEWREFTHAHFLESAEVQRRTVESNLDSILKCAGLIAACFRRSNKLLICGNGGSAADAQHMAAEFVNRLSKDFERPGLPALSLTTDTSFLTSYANDYCYDGVFERQLRALGQQGDVLIGISTSGNSRNVLNAMIAAHEMGIETIGLVGEGGEMTSLTQHAVVVPSRDTQYVQETLLTVEHCLCLLVERALFAASNQKE